MTWLAVLLGSAAGALSDPTTWAAMGVCGILAAGKLWWLWPLPAAGVRAAVIEQINREWWQQIGVNPSDAATRVFFATLLLCAVAAALCFGVRRLARR